MTRNGAKSHNLSSVELSKCQEERKAPDFFCPSKLQFSRREILFWKWAEQT